eukprot:g30272.t1
MDEDDDHLDELEEPLYPPPDCDQSLALFEAAQAIHKALFASPKDQRPEPGSPAGRAQELGLTDMRVGLAIAKNVAAAYKCLGKRPPHWHEDL